MNYTMKIKNSFALRPGTIALALACTLLAASCKSSDTTTTHTPEGTGRVLKTDPVLDKMKPEFIVNHLGGDKYYLGFNLGAGGLPGSPTLTALRGVTLATFVISAPDGAKLDSLATADIPSSGVANATNGEVSVTASGGVTWQAPRRIESGTTVELTLYGTNGTARRTATINSDITPKTPQPSVTLVIETQKVGKFTEFLVTARRVSAPPDGEYLPSGEKIRVELEDGAGQTVWSSSDGKMFTAVIGTVEPQTVGTEYKYRVLWDGRGSLTKQILPTGTYRVTATIPSKPKPYVVREEFSWSVN